MALTDYTSYDEVRAVLGVSDEELENATIALPIYDAQLQMQFEDMHPDLVALWEAAKIADPQTSAQKRLARILPVFASYAVASNLLMSLSMFAPKKITDGRAEVERVTDPYKHLRAELPIAFQGIKNRLEDILDDMGLNPIVVAGPRVLIGVSPLAIDPVTGAARV